MSTRPPLLNSVIVFPGDGAGGAAGQPVITSISLGLSFTEGTAAVSSSALYRM